jgi:phosphate acetyltransferase
MSNLIDQQREKARTLNKTIVLPEAKDDARTMKAARMFLDEKLGVPMLVGSPAELSARAAEAGISLDGMKTVDPASFDRFEEMIALYQKRRAKENLSTEQVRDLLLKEPLYFGALLVTMGVVDGMTAGALNTTANVIRASIKCIGTRPGIKNVSSCFLMVLPEPTFGANGALIYSDCGVIPAPTPDQLVDIGDAAAQSFRQLVGGEPCVAYLSFSTKGSADHEDAKKMADAAAALAQRHPDLKVDGELQGDAALVASIGERKCPGSPVAGKANTLIFPDLGAGNIAYKLTERLAKAQAFGPLLQGLAKPVNDLSRGCTSEDIVQVATITALQTL